MEILSLTDPQKELVARVEALAAEKIAPRAVEEDKAAAFPHENIKYLHAEGLLVAALDKDHGGLGFGFHQTDPMSFFLCIETLARFSPATAHCFQVHNNCVQLTASLGTEAQIERILEPTLARGALLPALGAEPANKLDDIHANQLGTIAKPVKGGYRVSGRKHYATNVPRAEFMWAMVATADTGECLSIAFPADSEGVSVDDSFWNPVGMRGCVSPMVDLEDVFVSEDEVLGPPNSFFTDNWFGIINFGFTANHLGALRAIYDYLLDYLRRGRGEDPMRQFFLGDLKSRIDAARVLYYTAVRHIKEDPKKAMVLAREAQWMTIETGHKASYLIGQAGGSTLLFRKHPVERFMRDLELHLLHERHHAAAQAVAQSELGLI